MPDFADIKRRFSIEKTAQLLGLVLKPASGGFRGPCPACKSGGERALAITPSRAGFYCFASKEHGDCIQLVAHIKGIEIKAAADWLDGTNREPKTGPVRRDGGTVSGFAELDYLEGDHPAVAAIGFAPEVIERLRLGYAPKGVLRGTVAIPLRDETGELLGYIGVEDCKLPPSLTTNVVPIPKRA